HGVNQYRNPWSDGPEYITQCPIQPGGKFKQSVVLTQEEGTLWWHAHSDWTRVTVYGAIVIYPRNGTSYPFPKPDADLPIIFGGDPTLSDAITINGQPGDLYECSKEDTFKLVVDYDKTYLLRLINAALEDILFVSVTGHQLTVVGTDGCYSKPFTSDYIAISPGQTIDVLLHANQTLNHYYMSAKFYSANRRDTINPTTATAIIQYAGNYTPPSNMPLPWLPSVNDTRSSVDFTTCFRSLANKQYPVDVPLKVDTFLFITVSMNILPCRPNDTCVGPEGSRLASSLNNISFVAPTSVDILEAYYDKINKVYGDDFPSNPPVWFNFTSENISAAYQVPSMGTKVKVLEYNSTVELVFQGTNLLAPGVDHPMHLHGTNYYVVGSGYGNFDKEKDPLKYNLKDPPRQNTIAVPRNGWAAIRFRASNPGVWFMHCHLERHLTWGMDMISTLAAGILTRHQSRLSSASFRSSILHPAQPDYIPIYQSLILPLVKEASYTRLCKENEILTVNEEFPGPTLYVHKGDTIIVDVINHSPHNITLHWHGVAQPRNPWADGPEYITQCPVQPGGRFSQRVEFSDEEGTLWWHAHSEWTRATVHGAIVVRPKIGCTYPFPKPHAEVPIIFGEWWKNGVLETYTEFLHSGGDPNASDAITINGQPGDLFPCSKSDTFRLNVDHGKTYLLRLVNAVLQDMIFFGIDGHQLTVVGTDGSYVKPFKSSYITISPGQTFDVLLQALPHSSSSASAFASSSPSKLQEYYMAAKVYSSNPLALFDNTTATAILHYNHQNPQVSSRPLNTRQLAPQLPYLPDVNDTNASVSFTDRLRSLAPGSNHFPRKISTKLFFTLSINAQPCPNNSCPGGPNGMRLASSINNVSFVSPKSIDILSAYYNNVEGVFKQNFPHKPKNANVDFAGAPPLEAMAASFGTKARVIRYNSTVEVVLQGTNLAFGVDHPIHFHGMNVYMVGWGFGNFNVTRDPLSYNLVDPPFVNTVAVPRNGWVVVRFKASNPGVWLMHCHLERHQTWGMGMVFIVKNGRGRNAQMLPPPPDMPPC
ncbi:LAC14, partial [Linum perenne]